MLFDSEHQPIPFKPATTDTSPYRIATHGPIKVEPGYRFKPTESFPTAVFQGANITSGKHYYETKLSSGGLHQIGFVAPSFEAQPNAGRGVGDDAFSWAYDGSRQCFFALNSTVQGTHLHAWNDGDVIGCGVDLDDAQGTITFFKNGVPLEPVFRDVKAKLGEAGEIKAAITTKPNFWGSTVEFQFRVYAGQMDHLPDGYEPWVSGLMPADLDPTVAGYVPWVMDAGAIELLDMDRLVVGSGFPTAMAKSTRFAAGKKYYEVLLETNGLWQIGLAADGFKPVPNAIGAGDDEFSWAVDLSRQCFFGGGQRVERADPLHSWRCGDIIGVAVDLDDPEVAITFFKNGTELGHKFTGIREKIGEGGVFPCITSQNAHGVEERLIVRMHGGLMKHLPPGYTPPLEGVPERDPALTGDATPVRFYSLGEARITDESQVTVGRGFPTVWAPDLRVGSGKRYFEVKISHSGLMQIGVAGEQCQPAPQGYTGVGDDEHSWAFDGSRHVFFAAGQNVQGSPETHGWAAGDVIGVAIDLETEGGELRFFKNGTFLEPAFTNVAAAAGSGFVPAVSAQNTHEQQAYMFRIYAAQMEHMPDGFAPIAAGFPPVRNHFFHAKALLKAHTASVPVAPIPGVPSTHDDIFVLDAFPHSWVWLGTELLHYGGLYTFARRQPKSTKTLGVAPINPIAEYLVLEYLEGAEADAASVQLSPDYQHMATAVAKLGTASNGQSRPMPLPDRVVVRTQNFGKEETAASTLARQSFVVECATAVEIAACGVPTPSLRAVQMAPVKSAGLPSDCAGPSDLARTVWSSSKGVYADVFATQEHDAATKLRAALLFSFAVKCCHDGASVLHNDIALRNFITDGETCFQIHHFHVGLPFKREVMQEHKRVPYVHTARPLLTSAPESLEPDADGLCYVSTATDVFQLGWALHHLFSGSDFARDTFAEPLSAGGIAALREAVASQRPSSCPDGCPEPVFALTLRCLSTDPSARPSAAEIVQELGRLVVEKQSDMEVLVTTLCECSAGNEAYLKLCLEGHVDQAKLLDSSLPELPISLDKLDAIFGSDASSSEIDLTGEAGMFMGPAASLVGQKIAAKSELAELTLTGCNLNPTSCSALLETLHSATKLKTIDMVANSVGDEGCVAIGDFLKRPDCVLTELDLGMNGISDKGLATLADALKASNKSLRVLGLRRNALADKALPTLTELLEACPWLERVHIFGNKDMPDKVVRRLVDEPDKRLSLNILNL